MNVASLLESARLRYGDRLAVSDASRSLNYSEYSARAEAVATALRSSGLGSSHRVAVLLHNSVEYAEVIFGIALAGLTAVHISYRLTPAEMAYLLENSNVGMIIYDKELEDVVAEIRERFGFAPAVSDVVVGGEPQLEHAAAYEGWILAQGLGVPSQAPTEIGTFYIGYTSGTTGRPKGAVITHDSRVLTATMACLEYGFSDGETTLMFTPMHHGGPLVFVLTPLVVGGHLRVMRHFDEEEVAWNAQQYPSSNAFAVPTILTRMTDSPADVLGQCRDRLRVIVSNAAPLATSTKETLLSEMPAVQLHEFYGSTEAGIVTNLRPSDQSRKVRCAGQPFLLNHVEILGDDGIEVPAGEVGRLFSRSPYLFGGYLNLPEATASAYHRGLVGVGDLATKDDEGFVYIVDRESDMILSGGVNIYPREIEDALLLHPEIVEVAVVGRPSREWGEEVVAYVVTNSSRPVEQLVAEAIGDVAPYKRPRQTFLVESLPRNSTGKLLKRELRDQAAATGTTPEVSA